MIVGIQSPDEIGFRPIAKLVSDGYFALTFGYKEDVIIPLRLADLLILLAKYGLWGLQHSIHPFHDILNDVVVINFVIDTWSV